MILSHFQSQLDQGEGIARSLEQNKASWHKSCRDKISNRSLERRRKLQDTEDDASSVKTRRNTSSCHEENVCFFCDGPAVGDDVHKALTFGLDSRVRHCATVVNDKNLLKKLAFGDMIATDAVYHNKCFQKLYRQAAKAEASESDDKQNGRIIESIAFAEHREL